MIPITVPLTVCEPKPIPLVPVGNRVQIQMKPVQMEQVITLRTTTR